MNKTSEDSAERDTKTEGSEAWTIGTVVLLDALGFKGIWQRRDKNEVLNSMRSMKEHARSYTAMHDVSQMLAAEDKSRLTGVKLETRFWSDSVVIASHVTLDDSISKQLQFLRISYTLGVALLAATRFIWDSFGPNGTRLTYRGAVSCGRFLIDEDFLIGPAVDEAAEHCERPDGAMVWFTSSAREVLSSIPKGICDSFILRNWDLPMSRGDSLKDAVVLNPTRDGRDEPKRQEWISSVLATFTGDGRVSQKRSNTALFLDAAS